jgi:Mrp family chromosome partitioning ATPase
VLVVQPAKNHRRMVLRAVEAIRSLDVRVLGVAVNRLSSDSGHGYDDPDAAFQDEYGCDDYSEDAEEDDADTVAVQFAARNDLISPRHRGDEVIGASGRPALRRAA